MILLHCQIWIEETEQYLIERMEKQYWLYFREPESNIELLTATSLTSLASCKELAEQHWQNIIMSEKEHNYEH